ncbi:MAG: virulence RhuM family protein [Prevotellaceae bacterium]|jgi:hypothetical protein|nr:virulence RhuM family protein [Prevotellaceae bacterium]
METTQEHKLQNTGQILLYQTDDGKVTVDVSFENETFWMTQKAIAELFGVNVPAISKHLKNTFESGELLENSVISKMETTASDGKNYLISFYNLDAIIAVGYRVNSKRATKFRQWATNTLKEYIIKGFVINDELLKNGKKFGKDYFDELLERIREIRASERRAYQKIADIFEQCSADYDPTAEETKLFYAFVQNKMHYAVTGQTAAEIVYKRADSNKPYMGLTTWKNAPHGKVMKSDVAIAKNYLNRHEIDFLNRLVTAFIDFAELRALNHKITTMREWLDRTNEFLKFAEQPVLNSAGRISHEQALKKAIDEYEIFRKKQDQEYLSYFDSILEKYLKGKD